MSRLTELLEFLVWLLKGRPPKFDHLKFPPDGLDRAVH